jgi:hypothetical protein
MAHQEVRIAVFITGCTEPAFVGGDIEGVPMNHYTDEGIGDGLILVCNEEGKLEGLLPTRWVPGDVICGSFFVARVDEETVLTDLTPDDERLLSQWTPDRVWGEFK